MNRTDGRSSPARAVVDVGSVIADTYKIEALLGRGGMGSVFLASHRRLAGKHVAIKILHTELEDADIVARFRREAEIAAKLNHPNIVGVIDYNLTPDGMPYLVLDYLEGETLAHRIARGPLPLEHVLSILRQIGSALAAAHRAGIVHRDLKPQNIFLVPTEVDGRLVEIAKVLDFGISKIRGSQTVKTQDSALLGTPQYMAPEQATGQHANVDERTDLFALGAIVYEMLSGQPAFSGASIPEVVFKVVYEQPVPLSQYAPSVPPAIVAAVNQAMAKPADERFPSVTRFVEAITGQPLTLPRGQFASAPPGADSPSAARRVATGEAFDRTIGPGEAAGVATDPLLATAAQNASTTPVASRGPSDMQSLPAPRVLQDPQGPHDLRGMQGLQGPPGTLTPGAPAPHATASKAAPTVDLGPKATAEPARRLSPGVIAAIVLAGAALAGGAVFVATRPDDTASRTPAAQPDDRSDRDRVAAGSGSAAPAVVPPPSPAPAPPPVVPVPPAPGPGSAEAPAPPVTPTAPPPDPTVAPGRPKPGPASQPGGRPKPPPPIDDEEGEEEGDDDVRQKLKQASAALERRDYDLAERLAMSVINAPAGRRQHAAARLIHGSVQCAARNDQEAAGIALRGLAGFRAMRAKLLATCRSHGILIGP
jgi:eukaryotic-like serine/threonine-protein kinase